MTDEQFFKISILTDEILAAKNVSPARVAIQWLHLIRPTPSFLKSYENIFNTSIYSYFFIIIRSIRNKLSLLAVLLQSILSTHETKWKQSLDTLSANDVLIVSHLLNKYQYEQKEDFYFSEIQKELQCNGFTTLVAMINHTGKSFIDNNVNSFQNKKLVLPKRLIFHKELKNLKLLWVEYKTLLREMRLERNRIKKKVLLFAAIEALSSSSLTSLRIANLIAIIIKSLKPNVLITTYEGYAWERTVYEAVRNVNPKIKCFGYTHAPIFEKQHAVKRSLSKMYNPDIILNSGNTQKKQIERDKLLNNIPTIVIGSVRCFEAGVDNCVSQPKLSVNSGNKQFCLVVPEGNESEINILFKFSIDCAKKMTEVDFIWRLHPLYSFNKFSMNFGLFNSLPTNIILSDNELKTDFGICQWVLYRSSSVVIQAVVAGLKPIYFHRSGEIRIDPIYEINKWKKEIETVDGFIATLKSEKRNYEDYIEAKKYCIDMYTPLNCGLLIDTLKKINNNE